MNNFKSRDDKRRERELEEARKAGTIPAEVDEDGKEVNPHIPQYMSQAPWYLNQEGPGLKHQKNLKTKMPVAGVSDFVPRGQKAGPAATKFRKGACTNCGAMTHKAQDCVERPRKKGAKFTGKGIQADDATLEMAFDYAGKRDHWAQYDASQHASLLQTYEQETELRLQATQQEKAAKLAAKEERRRQKRAAKEKAREGEEGAGDPEEETDTDTDGEGDDDEAKERSANIAVGEKMNMNKNGGMKMSVRNLRIREDTAKYLLNLDTESAYYDPKTRSMRENPNPGGDPNEASFAGDNFVRASGDAKALAQLQLYQLDAHAAGQNVHMNADPTTLELMNKIFREKKEKLAASKSNKILEKYGGAEHMEAPPKELLLAQTESYVEYDRSGAVVAGQEKAIAKSKYVEDILTHNHTAVWGSFFDRATFRWGYADDHSTMRNSYSTGAAGLRARAAAAAALTAGSAPDSRSEAAAAALAAAAAGGGSSCADAGGGSKAPPTKQLYGLAEDLGEHALDEAKVKAAIAREKKRGSEVERDDRKRKYNSAQADDMGAEEMEAYHRTKLRADDPMANYQDGELTE